MPIKYIGKPTLYVGKKLFEILGNLKNFGVGRVVIRQTNLRFPEPSYYKIARVQPIMDKENKFGRVWVEVVFRGYKLEKLRRIGCPFKNDFQLLSKEEAAAYCKEIPQDKVLKVLPRFARFPPLMRELIMRDRKNRGDESTEEPLLPLQYMSTRNPRYKKAKTPSVLVDTFPQISLYENIVNTRPQ